MATVSTGQITIIDLYDAPALNAWISASQTTTQTYNATTKAWSPSYATTAQVLTLALAKAGSTTSILGGVTAEGVRWYKTVGSTKTEITSTLDTATEYKGGTKNATLTVKVNVPDTHSQVIYSAEGTYTDPDTGLPISFSAQIPITLVQLAKAAIIGNVSLPKGDFFRNNTPASLTVSAELYKDGALSSGSKKIKWFAAESSLPSQDPDGGVGWRKITATSGATGAVANTAFDVATTGQGTLTVYPDAVASSQTFKAVITDNAGGTSGQKVVGYATIKDLDDPIMVIVDSSGGDVLKNGVGTTTLRARLFQNGSEIDAGPTYAYTYTWTRWQNNAQDAAWGTAGIKLGKEVGIGPADVDTKTMFKVEVSK